MPSRKMTKVNTHFKAIGPQAQQINLAEEKLGLL